MISLAVPTMEPEVDAAFDEAVIEVLVEATGVEVFALFFCLLTIVDL